MKEHLFSNVREYSSQNSCHIHRCRTKFRMKVYNFISIFLVWAALQLFQVYSRFWSTLTPELSTLDWYRSESFVLRYIAIVIKTFCRTKTTKRVLQNEITGVRWRVLLEWKPTSCQMQASELQVASQQIKSCEPNSCELLGQKFASCESITLWVVS